MNTKVIITFFSADGGIRKLRIGEEAYANIVRTSSIGQYARDLCHDFGAMTYKYFIC